MNYPKSIYKNYRIVEKNILGKPHYAVARVFSIAGFTIKVPVRTDSGGLAYIGAVWHASKQYVEKNLRAIRRNEEEDYYYKLTS